MVFFFLHTAVAPAWSHLPQTPRINVSENGAFAKALISRKPMRWMPQNILSPSYDSHIKSAHTGTDLRALSPVALMKQNEPKVLVSRRFLADPARRRKATRSSSYTVIIRKNVIVSKKLFNPATSGVSTRRRVRGAGRWYLTTASLSFFLRGA